VHEASDEAFLVVEGTLEVALGEARVRVAAGEHVHVPAGTAHTFRTVGEAPVRVVAIMTPEVDELVRQLHEVSTDQERQAVWARHRSRLV
jgi:mannose-6-phosphate isomerase-like protein (cupin superfamily)